MSGRLGAKVRIWYVTSQKFEKNEKLASATYVYLALEEMTAVHMRDGLLFFGRRSEYGPIRAYIYTTEVYEYFLSREILWGATKKLRKDAGPWELVPDDEVLPIIVEGRLHRG